MTELHHTTIAFAAQVTEFSADLLLGEVEFQDTYIDRFGIDDARALVHKAHQRPDQASFQVLVVRTDFVTYEAQNALLKILEEPPVSTKFLFVLPIGFELLSTVRSRADVLQSAVSTTDAAPMEFGAFLNASYAERLQQIDEAVKKKDVVWQRAMKSGLLHFIPTAPPELLFDLEYVARLLLTRGASNKFLLEHLALVLPARFDK